MKFFTREFIKKYKFILLAGFLLIFLLGVILLPAYPTQKKQQPLMNPTPTISSQAATATPAQGPGQPDAGTFEKTWETSSTFYFSEDLLKGVVYEKKELADGTIFYTYASANSKRPDMIAVKDGLVIFNRMVLRQMTMDNYVLAYGKPDYIARGSAFYGPDAVTYVYPTRGRAFVGNPQTNTAFEEMAFKPIPGSEFKREYGGDLIGELEKI